MPGAEPLRHTVGKAGLWGAGERLLTQPVRQNPLAVRTRRREDASEGSELGCFVFKSQQFDCV